MNGRFPLAVGGFVCGAEEASALREEEGLGESPALHRLAMLGTLDDPEHVAESLAEVLALASEDRQDNLNIWYLEGLLMALADVLAITEPVVCQEA